MKRTKCSKKKSYTTPEITERYFVCEQCGRKLQMSYYEEDNEIDITLYCTNCFDDNDCIVIKEDK